MAADPEATRQIEPEILRRFGLFIVHFALIEKLLADLFVRLTEGEPGSMIVVTANVSQTSLSDWIRTLLDLRPSPQDWANEIRDTLTELDTLRGERNALVHGLWSTVGPAHSVIVQTVKLDRREVIKERVLTTADINDLIQDGLDVMNRLRAILRSLGVV
jgi:hypothetical protein